MDKLNMPSVSLPGGGGALKGIGETFQPNAFSGTAGYTIPIPLTQGRGFIPSLALNYSSGSGNGPFGAGWNLSLQTISVRTEKGIPRYDGTDVYLFNGTELVPKNNSQRTVTESGTEWNVQEYLPRLLSDNTRIECWTSADGVFWRTISAGNTVSEFGRTPAARISDPVDTTHIFSWLIETATDPKGNKVHYDYQSENGENTGSFGRSGEKFSQKYIDSIRYGNYFSTNGEERFAFEVVFDYGQYDLSSLGQPEADPYKAANGRACRPDPFSTFRSGFEIRTYRRCSNILLFHCFEHENGGKPFLVNRCALDYYASADYAGVPGQEHIFSCLKTFRVTGCRLQADGSYELLSKPDLDFTFSAFAVAEDAAFSLLDVNGETIPGQLSPDQFLPVDLYGEGLPGFLLTQDGGSLYYSPLGGGKYEMPATLPDFPVSGSGTIVDLNGNGMRDLLVSQPSMNGYFENSAAGWKPFQPFTHYPVAAQTTESADLDADGKLDLLLVDRNAVTVYPSLGTEGYAAPQTIPVPEDFPLTSLNSAKVSVTFSDVFGDGLPHRVAIANGSVSCWPCLGYGRFGDEIVLQNAPYFENGFDTKRAFLADLNGTGASDLVYVSTTEVSIFLNQSGNGFADPVTITLPEAFDELDTIQFADVLGTGTSCLVFSKLENEPRHYFLNFAGTISPTTTTIKPYLLTAIVNNHGSRTELHYTSSTHFYLADKAAGKPWATQLPFPVQVLDRITRSDAVSGTFYIQEFSYHDGYYDPVEREFRGFGFVETRDTQTYAAFTKTAASFDFPVDRLNEELYVPPTYTKSWYNTGAFASSGELEAYYRTQYFQGDAHAYAFPDSIFDPAVYASDAETFREAFVALSGQVMRTEVYGLDGTPESMVPFAVEQSNNRVVLIQEKGDRPYGVFRVDPREHIAYHYERNANDPRVEQQFTIAVDPKCGSPTKTCTFYLPRRPETITGVVPQPEQVLPQALIGTTDYINTDDDGNYWCGIAWQEQQFQLCGIDLGTALYIDFDTCSGLVDTALNAIVPYAQLTDGKVEAQQFAWSRTYFWDEPQKNYLPGGEIASRGLQAYSETAQFNQSYLDAAYQGKLSESVIADLGGYCYDKASAYWWNKGVVQVYFDPAEPEQFYLQKAVTNPFAPDDSTLSVRGEMRYDSPYNMVAVELTEYIDPAKDSKNVQYIVLDYNVCLPQQLIDVNGNVSQVLYDPLGQVVVSTLFGIRNDAIEGGALLYAYDRYPAEYVPRTKTQKGDPITLPDVVENPHYYVQGALSYHFYDEHEWTINAQPLAAVSVIRSTYDHGDATQPVYPIRIEYTDGFGRIAEQKELVDPGAAFGRTENGIATVDATQRWKVSGRTVYNNKGLPAEQYLPYFSNTALYETQNELTDSGLVPPPSILHYDATGRLIRTDEPKGFFSKTVFTPWEEAVFDANDTILDAPYYIDFMAHYPADPTQAQKDEKNALEKAVPCYDTPVITVFDATGTQFLHIVNNLGKLHADSFDGIVGSTGIASAEVFQELIVKSYVSAEGWLTSTFTPYVPGFQLALDPKFAPLLQPLTALLLQGVLTTYSETDIQSRVLLQIDPRLYYSNQSTGTRYFSMRNWFEMGASTATVTETPDAGLRPNFNNLFGLNIWSWTPRNYNQLVTYDRLQRKTELRVKRFPEGVPNAPFDEFPLVEQFTYGESVPDATEYNLRGQLYELKDLSGILTQKSYNLRYQLTEVSRQMTTVYKDAIDWRADVPLDPDVMTTGYVYNAIGQVVSETAPDGTTTKRGYTLSGLPKTIALVLADGTQKPVINAIDYNASDQRLSVNYENTSATRFTYDDLTQRLSTVKNTRSATGGRDPQLQNVTYVYDPVGNITRKRDLSRDVAFYNNQKIEPLLDYTYDMLYRLVEANGYQHPGIRSNTYQNNRADGDFKQSKFTVSPSDYSALENYVERYRYDDSGNLVSLRHSAVSASWTRDLSVEANSNRLANTTFDESGNLRQILINKPVSLDYNCCENLIKAGIITRPDQPDDADYYVYDSHEQRTRKVCEAMAFGGASSTIENTVYNGNYQVKLQQTVGDSGSITTTLDRQTLRIMDGNNCVLVMHYWKLDANNKEMPTGTRSYRWQLGDQLESVCIEVDDTAQLISYEEYFPYGGTAIIAGPSEQEVSLKTYRYSGKERDDTTGLYYYGQRYYATWLARWNKPDPAGAVDGLNLYAFAVGNPIVLKDKDGLSVKGAKKKPTRQRAKRSKETSKKARKEKTEEVRDTISDDYEPKMKKRKKIHQSDLFTGETEKIVAPNTKMSKERLLVRHIATALLSQNDEFTEVQAAISHKDKTIYVASNKKQSELFKLLPGQLKDFNVPDKDKSNPSRVNRHLGKLKKEITGDYSDYQFVQIVGHEEQHAETKIVEWTIANKKPFDFIGGTRRPCFACSLFMSILGVSKTAYNQHPGAYWNSISALLSLGPYLDDYKKVAYEGYFYRNKGVSDSHVHDYDTDSEDED